MKQAHVNLLALTLIVIIITVIVIASTDYK